MTLIRIDIPSAAPDPATVRSRAGQIVIDALREAGIDERKAIRNPMICTIVEAWGRNEIDRADVVSMCRKVLILNPGLATGGTKP